MAKWIFPTSVGGRDPDLTPSGEAQAIQAGVESPSAKPLEGVDTYAVGMQQEQTKPQAQPRQQFQSPVGIPQAPAALPQEPAGIVFPASIGGTDPDVQQQPEPKQMGYLEGIKSGIDRTAGSVGSAFSGKDRLTEETKDLGEFAFSDVTAGTDWDATKRDVKTAVGMMTAANDDARKDIIKENFPDLEMYDDEKGSTIIVLPDGTKTLLNKPGMSGQDVSQFLGDMAMFFGPSKIAGLGKGLLAKMGLGAVASGATEAARQKGTQLLGSKQDVSGTDVALATVLGGAAETVGPLAKGFKEGRQAKKLGVLKEETKGIKGAVEEGIEASKQTGIELFPGQVTLSPSALRKQAALQQLDGSSLKTIEKIKTQDKQIGEAVEDVLGTIAHAKTIDDAPKMVRDAAEKAIKRQLGKRQAAAGEVYKEAFKNKKNVVLPKTHDKLEALKKTFKPDSDGMKWLEKLEKKFTKGNIEQHHSTKLELDGMFERFGGDSALVSNQKRMLTEVKGEFLKDLKRANKTYEKARKIFSSESPAVDKINQSFLGKMSKIDEFDNAKLDQIVPTLFKPRTTDAQIKQFKKVIQKESPEAWDAITRRRFEDLLVKKGYDSPDKLFTALFANKANKKQLYASLSTENAKRLKYLETAAERSSKGRFRGTDTATKMEDIKDIDSGAWSVIGGIFTPLESIKGVLSGMSKTQRRSILADTMYNTKWSPDWSILRKMQPGSKAAKNKFRQLVEKAGRDFSKQAAQAARTETTQGE